MKKILKILKKVKLKTFILAIMLLMFNTYAWFIYAAKVNTQFSAHVESWNIDFKVDDTEETNIKFVVDRVYPGMDDYEKTVNVANDGDMVANISYQINKIRIFDQTYTRSDTTTSQELVDMLENDYPFSITIELDKDNISTNASATYKIKMVWPFDSGNDEEDTKWGNKAYTYFSTTANATSIEIDMDLIATQKAET